MLWILVLGNILLELRKGQSVGASRCPSRARILCEEFVDDLGEKLMGNERGVFMIRDNDAGESFAASVGVECVGLLFDILSLARSCAFGNGLTEECHEFPNTMLVQCMRIMMAGGVYFPRVKRE